MTQRIQNPHRRVFDFCSADDGRVTIAEFKNCPGGFIGYWWTTGLNAANQLTLLGEFQIVWASIDAQPDSVAEKIYNTHVRALVSMASGVTGMVSLTSVFLPEFRASLLTEHLKQHEELGNYSDESDGLIGSIAKQYQLAVSLGASTSVEFLASWNEVPVSTIKKRLERARLEGLIPLRRPNGPNTTRDQGD